MDAPQRGVSSTHLQGRLIYDNTVEFKRIVDFDIATGVRFSVLSYFVKVHLLLPRIMKETTQGRPEPPILRGLGDNDIVADALVCGTVSQSGAPVGRIPAPTYTQTIFVPALSAVARVAIPSAAKRVQVFQDAGAATSPLTFRLATIAGATGSVPPFALGPDIGVLDFTAGQNRTAIVDIPGRATHIAADTPNPFDDRRLTFIFELEI